jgi:hypothetical protein
MPITTLVEDSPCSLLRKLASRLNMLLGLDTKLEAQLDSQTSQAQAF